MLLRHISVFFFFNDTATTEIYTLSLHDALPICMQLHATAVGEVPAHPFAPGQVRRHHVHLSNVGPAVVVEVGDVDPHPRRSEEHTSELQSQSNLVCRLLLEKKKQLRTTIVACQH